MSYKVEVPSIALALYHVVLQVKIVQWIANHLEQGKGKSLLSTHKLSLKRVVVCCTVYLHVHVHNIIIMTNWAFQVSCSPLYLCLKH